VNHWQQLKQTKDEKDFECIAAAELKKKNYVAVLFAKIVGTQIGSADANQAVT
jgi:hypothetical protein